MFVVGSNLVLFLKWLEFFVVILVLLILFPIKNIYIFFVELKEVTLYSHPSFCFNPTVLSNGLHLFMHLAEGLSVRQPSSAYLNNFIDLY